jgi:SAM-dependent methyltransferase
MPTDSASHWRQVWSERDPTQVSWFQAEPRISLELILRHAPDPSSTIVDVGGGSSPLAARLLALGYLDVTVVDIAEPALDRARSALGDRAGEVTWLVADATRLDLTRPADLWHDRAMFHFLTDPVDQQAYATRLAASLRPGGTAIVATFALGGPTTCSGLPVVRYDSDDLAATLGLELVASIDELHRTPAGYEQPFTYAVLRRPISEGSP